MKGVGFYTRLSNQARFCGEEIASARVTRDLKPPTKLVISLKIIWLRRSNIQYCCRLCNKNGRCLASWQISLGRPGHPPSHPHVSLTALRASKTYRNSYWALQNQRSLIVGLYVDFCYMLDKACFEDKFSPRLSWADCFFSISICQCENHQFQAVSFLLFFFLQTQAAF